MVCKERRGGGWGEEGRGAANQLESDFLPAAVQLQCVHLYSVYTAHLNTIIKGSAVC